MSTARLVFFSFALAACGVTSGASPSDDQSAALTGNGHSHVDCPAPKVLVCHVPPGNPANAHEICISASAVPAHVAHGDARGGCANGNGGAGGGSESGGTGGGTGTGGGDTGGTGGGAQSGGSSGEVPQCTQAGGACGSAADCCETLTCRSGVCEPLIG